MVTGSRPNVAGDIRRSEDQFSACRACSVSGKRTRLDAMIVHGARCCYSCPWDVGAAVRNQGAPRAEAGSLQGKNRLGMVGEHSGPLPNRTDKRDRFFSAQPRIRAGVVKTLRRSRDAARWDPKMTWFSKSQMGLEWYRDVGSA